MALSGKSARDIHRELLKSTINERKIFTVMSKVADKAVKTVDRRKDMNYNGALLLITFGAMHYNSKIKKVINHECMERAEDKKSEVISTYILESRDEGKWIYLASSHRDSAEDHAPYQGKLYYDNKAPEDVIEFCKKRGYKSLQWVMDGPVWFVTRPNCRHFFKSLPTDVVKQYSRKELTRRYKMHRMDGDKSLATPAKIAVEEYEDRLQMLKGMYNQHQTEHLRRDIDKTKLLIKKWKKIL